MSETKLQAAKGFIDKNLWRKFIWPLFSKFRSPILFMPKKDGELWLCVNYQQLNAYTIKDMYPLPLILELHDQVSGAKWFMKLDLKEEYYYIWIKEDDKWKTIFRT